jgi:6-pyruvoyltetrahydropterin/6-carboxytetrahydropterin synthase
MLSKHPERCRYPHGHTRRIEVVVSREGLDENDMVLDFKALKLAVEDYIERYDHAMAINSNDPLRGDLERIHTGCTVVFDDIDPTTEVIAKDIYDFVVGVFQAGYRGQSKSGASYEIPANVVTLDRVRVWETPTSWAEYGD